MDAHVGNTTLMGWETRRRGSIYYTRSVRVNGVVRRHYHGNDDLAYLIASLDEERRLARETRAEVWRTEQAAALELEVPLIQFDAALDRLTAQTLSTAGYHRHNYGKWRKKRGTRTEHSPRTDPDEIRADRTG